MSCRLRYIVVCDHPTAQQRCAHHNLIEGDSTILDSNHFYFNIVEWRPHLVKRISERASQCLFNWNDVAQERNEKTRYDAQHDGAWLNEDLYVDLRHCVKCVFSQWY